MTPKCTKMIPTSSKMASFKNQRGVGGIGEAIRSAAPWPCARRVRRGRRTLEVLYVFIFFPQVQYVTLVMDLGPPPVPPTSPRPGGGKFCWHHFPTPFWTSFVHHFGITFEAPNQPNSPQATIPNRPSQSMCPIFGFGTFFVNL